MLVLEAIGNLGADAIIKDLNGQKYIAFSVAHTESYKDSQGQRHERTTWVSCLKYGESQVINYLKKGTRVFIRGELSAKAYEAGGALQAGINCRVRELQLLGGNRADQTEAPQQAVTTSAATPTYAPPAYQQPEEVDDLPFNNYRYDRKEIKRPVLEEMEATLGSTKHLTEQNRITP